MSADKPDEKPTVEIPAVPAWAVELTREVKGARSDIALVSNDLGLLKERVVLIEKRVTDGEERAARTSNAVKGQSQTDLAHEAKLAEFEVWKQEVATKADLAATTEAQTAAIVSGVKASIDGVFTRATTNPTLRRLAYAAAGLAFVLINYGMSYLTRPAPQPAPTQIQVTK